MTTNMTFELYSFINLFIMLFVAAGFILPALSIYFYASYKTYLAIIVSAVLLILPILVLGEHFIVMLPFLLSVLMAATMGILLRKFNQDFWYSLGYMVAAVMSGIVLGVVILYFYYGAQDIATLLADGFRNAFTNVGSNGDIASYGLNVLAQSVMFATDGVLPAYADVSAMDTVEKLDVIIPVLKAQVASSLPALIMGYSIISGVWTWLISEIMIKKRAEKGKPLEGIKEFKPIPAFSDWKLPRWFTNVLMLILLAAIIISFASQGPLLNVSYALQAVTIVILAIQGLAVANWWLKSKKVPTALNILICVILSIASLFFRLLLPMLGLLDIMFSIRMSDEQKQELRKRMEAIKKQVEDELNEAKDKKNREEEQNRKNNEDNNVDEDTDESEDEK